MRATFGGTISKRRENDEAGPKGAREKGNSGTDEKLELVVLVDSLREIFVLQGLSLALCGLLEGLLTQQVEEEFLGRENFEVAVRFLLLKKKKRQGPMVTRVKNKEKERKRERKREPKREEREKERRPTVAFPTRKMVSLVRRVTSLSAFMILLRRACDRCSLPISSSWMAAEEEEVAVVVASSAILKGRREGRRKREEKRRRQMKKRKED